MGHTSVAFLTVFTLLENIRLGFSAHVSVAIENQAKADIQNLIETSSIDDVRSSFNVLSVLDDRTMHHFTLFSQIS